MPVFKQLDSDSGDKCISLILSEWATEYTLYAIKISDVPIGLNSYNLQSKSATGSVLHEMVFAATQNKTLR